jgi:hypothetical protein
LMNHIRPAADVNFVIENRISEENNVGHKIAYSLLGKLQRSTTFAKSRPSLLHHKIAVAGRRSHL